MYCKTHEILSHVVPLPKDLGENFIISASPPCKWIQDHTHYYRIQPKLCGLADFFGVSPTTKLRAPQWEHPEYTDCLRYSKARDMPNRCTSGGQTTVKNFLKRLEEIQVFDPSVPLRYNQIDYTMYESAVDSAVKYMLFFLGIEAETQRRIAFRHFGKLTNVTLDCTAFPEDYTRYVFLLSESKTYNAHLKDGAFAQLVSSAIAAYQCNNEIRLKLKKATFSYMIFPAMIWIGSVPTFYRIAITRQLSMAVAEGGFRPTVTTEVAQLELPIPDRWIKYGMWRVKNRETIMTILENMRDFLPNDIDHVPSSWRMFKPLPPIPAASSLSGPMAPNMRNTDVTENSD
ncbi:hypothetical protein Clacol_005405 [Clathrus columnatus]|uniref:Uncharacterized protein n=1 Tax=Clathrus columnatus TaxID=1419009 RepID=A0AAV5AES7_9AGAM|nr:hypothetical protein Clacol_005405 [Clathrus columnatus]